MILYFVKRFWSYVHLKGAIEVLNIINIIINNTNEKNLYRPLQARENACERVTPFCRNFLLGYQMV